jgi:hypothetical protein
MTAINLTNSPSNGDTATVGSLTYTYNSTTSRWELGSPSGSGALSNEQVQDLAGAQLATNGSHTGISFAYDDSGDGAIDATVGTLNQNTTGSAATLTTPRNIGGVAFDGSADINLPGVNAAGTQNTSGTAATLTTPREINGVAFNGSADITVTAGGVTVYATMALLVAVTGMSAGNMAYVTANNNLYMYTGTGWFKVATVENNSPSAITGVAATTALAADGTATVITAVSTDPEGFPLTWSYSVTTGSLTNGGGASATVSQADNVFTITPTTTEAYAGTFSITFSATDGVNAVTAASAFTLAFAVDWTTASQQAKVEASDKASGDNFGQSGAISGDTTVWGAKRQDTNGTEAGAAYVFTRSGTTWSQQQKIQSSDIAAGDWFADSIDIDGDTIAVGARLGSPYRGAVYIFTRSGTTWSQQQKIQSSDIADDDRFGSGEGHNVAIDGDTLIVGANGESAYAGAAYVFTRSGTTWSQQAKLTASDAAGNDNFGRSLDLNGDTAIIGAHREDPTSGTDAGSAYIFTRSGTTWSQQAKLTASDAQEYDYFGRTVRVDGNYAVVGAYGEDTGGSSAGAAYVFIRSGTTWSQQQKIVSSDLQAGDNFGYDTDIEGDVIVVGAKGEDAGGSNAGALYVFTRSGTTWTQQKKLVASDAAASNGLGFGGVRIDNDTVISGAPHDDGSGYIFLGG